MNELLPAQVTSLNMQIRARFFEDTDKCVAIRICLELEDTGRDFLAVTAKFGCQSRCLQLAGSLISLEKCGAMCIQYRSIRSWRIIAPLIIIISHQELLIYVIILPNYL